MPPRQVLVVDDDADNLAMVEYALTDAGYSVRGTTDPHGVAALLADGWTPAVAVIDLMMPGQDGAQVAQWLRAQSPATRIVLYSAWPGAETLADFRQELAADVFLAKPYDLDDLLRAVEA